MRIVVVLLVFLVSVASGTATRADWLDDAWNGKMAAEHGMPAITVHPDGVSVVVPAAILDKALTEAGLTRADALRAFLGRYSPQCSHVLDLNIARPALSVDLQILAASPLDEVSPDIADEVTTAMEGVTIPAQRDERGAGKHPRPQVPHVTQLFKTMPEHSHFSIDYAPDKIVHCVAPQDPIS